MATIQAFGYNYFNQATLPIAVRYLSGDKPDQHLHDLTEVKHIHNFCELVIITAGTGIQWIDGIDYPVMTGDVFLLQGEKEHYFKKRNKLSFYNVMFDFTHLPLPMNELKKIPGYHALFVLEPNYRQRHNFASRLHLERVALTHCETLVQAIQLECNNRHSGYEAALAGLLIELIVYLSRQYSQTTTTSARALMRVANIIAKLESHYCRQWKLAELAKLAFMSENNLLLVFKEATGQSPIDYLIRIRIHKAMQLLQTTTLPIFEIATQVGFNDSNYFSRCFKRFTRTTPRTFRNQAHHAV